MNRSSDRNSVDPWPLRTLVALAVCAGAGFSIATTRLHAHTQAELAGCRVAADIASGELSGTVTDAQDRRIPGAGVTITCRDGEKSLVTGADGTFRVTLPADTHTVLVTALGLEPTTRKVTVVTNETATLVLALPVAGLTETVTVAVVRESRTATRTDTPLVEIPHSVSVVTAGQIREQASPNVQEAVRYAAGVRNERYGIDNRGDWVSIRGTDIVTSLLNGMRLPLTGYWGVIREEPFAFERMEIVRGPSSIIAGETEPGGVMNMISKRPRATPLQEIGVRFGSYGWKEIQFDATGPINGDRSLFYRLVTVGKDTGTQIEHADEQRILVAPSLTWRPSNRGSLTLYGEYQYDDSKNTYAFLGRAGTLEPAPNGPIPADLFIGEPSWDTYGGTRYRAGYETDFALGQAWRLRHNLRHDRVDGLMESMYAAWFGGFVDANGAPDPNAEHLGRYWHLYDDSSRVTATEVLAEGRGRTAGVAHTLLVGVDGLIHDSTQTAARGQGTPLNVYHPVYGTFGRPAFGTAAPTENEIRRIGLFVQDQMTLAERLHVRAGLRRDRVGNTVVGSEGTVEWATTGNVGVVYEVGRGFAPYVSYSESFTPIAGTTAAGEAFRPRRGEQIEAGLKWEAQGAPAQVAAAYFTINEGNRLTPDPVNIGERIQIGRADIQGVELEARTDAGPWTTIASYSWTEARASADAFGSGLDPGQQIQGIPEHQASVWATHDFTRLGLTGVTAGGGLRYLGRNGDGTGNVFVPSVTLVDLMGSYMVRNWRLAVNLSNVADKGYVATCQTRGDCQFGQRRTLLLTTGFTF